MTNRFLTVLLALLTFSQMGVIVLWPGYTIIFEMDFENSTATTCRDSASPTYDDDDCNFNAHDPDYTGEVISGTQSGFNPISAGSGNNLARLGSFADSTYASVFFDARLIWKADQEHATPSRTLFFIKGGAARCGVVWKGSTNQIVGTTTPEAFFGSLTNASFDTQYRIRAIITDLDGSNYSCQVIIRTDDLWGQESGAFFVATDSSTSWSGDVWISGVDFHSSNDGTRASAILDNLGICLQPAIEGVKCGS